MRIEGGGSMISRLQGVYGIGPGRDAMHGRAGALVAAKVEGKVDFRPQAAAPAEGVFQMYTRTADVNEVATAVALGRRLDVTG